MPALEVIAFSLGLPATLAAIDPADAPAVTAVFEALEF
jgi:hypothetical protein